MNWIRSLFCKHDWFYKHIHKGQYDYEQWFVCRKCGKKKDIND